MRKAVAGIIKFQDEIFAIERSIQLKAFPGYTSFPGGKVDKDEKVVPLDDRCSGEDPLLVSALIRELKEELDWDLLGSDCQELKLYGRARTPSFNPIRFDTYFYLIEVREKPIFRPDENEIKSCSWDTAEGWYQSFMRDELLMVPPTRKIFEIMVAGNESTEVVELRPDIDESREVPLIQPVGSIKQLLPLSHTFPPANRTNCFVLGDEKKIMIDPSPHSEEELQKLIDTCPEKKIDEIFLTHHHFDHHEFATELAQRWKVELSMSEDSYHRIVAKAGEGYFRDVKINFKKDGDELTVAAGERILLLHVPGHDEGQLAPYNENMKWMIVGDLIQTVGTVVVGDEEGNMAKYFDSLIKVIQMNPKFIFPSHGIAVGSILKLKETLMHREMREESILKLALSQKSQSEILESVYQGLDSKLVPYAQKTIVAHLDKLLYEGKINEYPSE